MNINEAGEWILRAWDSESKVSRYYIDFVEELFFDIFYVFVMYMISVLTLPMLRLLLSNAHGRKDFWKPSKTCHVGIHWKAPADNSSMSTHLPGFQSFSAFFASFCIDQISHQ